MYLLTGNAFVESSTTGTLKRVVGWLEMSSEQRKYFRLQMGVDVSDQWDSDLEVAIIEDTYQAEMTRLELNDSSASKKMVRKALGSFVETRTPRAVSPRVVKDAWVCAYCKSEATTIKDGYKLCGPCIKLRTKQKSQCDNCKVLLSPSRLFMSREGGVLCNGCKINVDNNDKRLSHYRREAATAQGKLIAALSKDDKDLVQMYSDEVDYWKMQIRNRKR